MKQSDLENYKERLVVLRARLRGEVSSMLDVALTHSQGEGTGAASDVADAGSDNWEQELALALTQSEEETLELINAALKRIEEGTYGVCIGSGAKIPKARLNAIPFTPYCVDYAAQLEQNG